MFAPLPKHRGQHAGLTALGVLAIAVVVVWTTSPRSPRRPVVEPDKPQVQAVSARPAAAVEAIVPAQPKRSGVFGTGVATYDETRTSHVAAPVHGWLQKKRVKSLARKVQPGEQLATIYSPEVYLATVDLLAELKDFHSQERLDQLRGKLFGWGMAATFVERIEKAKRPQGWLPLITRVGGIVVAEQGARGQLVEPWDREYFTITDPAYFWVVVEVPETDVGKLDVGTPATLTIDGLARPLPAKVSYIYRRSGEETRTVRFDIHKAGLGIKPNSKVTAEFKVAAK